MDFESVIQVDDGVILKNVVNFEPIHTFDCGQCFRWNADEEGSYIGVAYGKVIKVKKFNDDVKIYNTNVDEFNNIWKAYFDFERDYSSIKNELRKDPILEKAVDFGSGFRNLRQDPFEIIISFIISANNMIPRIKKSVEKISMRWGKAIEYDGKTYYTFPSIEEFKGCSEEELAECGVGFRAKYIKNTVDALNRSWIQNLSEMDDDECYKELQKLSGVGPKVADCIMLFSMGRYSSFPVDVWVKRAMQHFYLAPDVSLKNIRKFGRDKFGKYAGFAQQYLFYYARENKIKV